MRQKPWPIITFAAFIFFIPFFGILGNALMIQVSPVAYIQAFFKVKTALEIAEFFMFFPIAALCIYLMKPWSYPVFLGVSGWAMFNNYMVWRSDYQGDLRATVAFFAFTGGLVLLTGYYLMPQVRRVFFDEGVRWWERKRRYLYAMTGELVSKEGRGAVELQNISETGALIKTSIDLDNGDEVNLLFKMFDEDLPIGALVVRKDDEQKKLYGLKFQLSSDSKKRVSLATQQLATKGVSHNQENGMISFNSWVKGLPKGRGFFPEIHS